MISCKQYDSEVNGLNLTFNVPENGKKDKFFIMFHGFTGSRFQPPYNELAYTLCEKSINVIRVEFRGHDKSKFPFENFRIEYAYEDAENVINLVKREYNPKRIGLVGVSMGGHVAIYSAAKFSDINALVLLAPAINFIEVFRNPPRKVENYYLVGRYGNLKLKEEGYLSVARANVMNLAEKIFSPTLIIHCKDDSVVPYTQSITFFEKIKAEKKKLVLIEKGDHFFEPDEVKNKVIEEVNSFLPAINF
ncbi:alpha/beta fold hydrolase [Sulfolobus sp. E5-1-F]|uniref:alpha/beta hydrolase n=1 Tax=Saccharolobus sp. E5-1-F TaxID=2663019 RepID=UPI00129822A6|nr:alpha/beta fold hydrolase [Sulfolobus sp. E5-1-F]QGA55341.1 alpha/beta fold hydrolase [Sulfolobus sp. E5-1-F]